MPKPDVVKAVDTDPEIETPTDHKIETSAARDPFDDLNSRQTARTFSGARATVDKILKGTKPADLPMMMASELARYAMSSRRDEECVALHRNRGNHRDDR
jgi:hypothetical protein